MGGRLSSSLPTANVIRTMPSLWVLMTGKEAILYKPIEGTEKVVCTACARYCKIGPGQIGLCGIRGNQDGKLWLYVYGKVIAGHIDPIEKKPVTHYRPGSKIFSIATTGCNWLCHPAGTEILMKDGTTKRVEDIGPGDRVWSYDVENNLSIRPNVVTHNGSRTAEIWEIRYGTRGHNSAFLTEEHPVLTKAGWSTVKELEPGDDVLKAWPNITETWRQKKAKRDVESDFKCGKCGDVFIGITDWNRHRGKCYTEGLQHSSEQLERYRQHMLANNPMKNPEIARRVRETQRADFLKNPDHGWHQNVERLRSWLHRHPSDGQLQLYKLLDELGVSYEKELRIHHQNRLPASKTYYIADAALPNLKLDIEVDGWWHYNNAQVMEQDRIRDDTFRANGWNVLRLSGSYLYNHPEEVKTLICEEVAQPIMVNMRYWLTVKAVRSTGRVETVYSFECIPNHTYVADGLVVHNCAYCQNADISQRRKVEGLDATPEQVAQMALRYRSDGIAYTYNQPTIFIEYAHDIGVIARQQGLINIFVSNGYDTPDSVNMMKDFLDCITVDFKGSGEEKFVRKYIGITNAQPIFDTLRELKEKTDIHVEITDLIVPQVGDNLDEARKLSKFVYDLFGPDMPIHFLRWHPDYKMMDLPMTPIPTLEKHCQVAKEVGLKYVYIGNVPGHPLEHTYCPGCGRIAIKRFGFDITGWNLDKDNKCKACGYQLPIVGPLADSVREDRFRPVIW